MDVVSPEPLTDWTKDPWGGEVDGDFLYGRGAGEGWRAHPHEQDSEDPFVKLVVNRSKQLTGIQPSYMGGSAGLDTRFFVHHGIPAVVYGSKAEGIHYHDERVDIDSTLNVAKVIATTVVEWCREDNFK